MTKTEPTTAFSGDRAGFVLFVENLLSREDGDSTLTMTIRRSKRGVFSVSGVTPPSEGTSR